MSSDRAQLLPQSEVLQNQISSTLQSRERGTDYWPKKTEHGLEILSMVVWRSSLVETG